MYDTEGKKHVNVLDNFSTTLSRHSPERKVTGIKGGKVKHELRVQIHELRVQIHELRVQIHELEQ